MLTNYPNVTHSACFLSECVFICAYRHVCSHARMFVHKHHYQYDYSYHCFPQHDQQLEFLGWPCLSCAAVYCADKRHMLWAVVFLIVLHKQMFSLCCFVSLSFAVPVTTREGVWRLGPRLPRSHDRFHLSHLPQVLVLFSLGVQYCLAIRLDALSTFTQMWTRGKQVGEDPMKR